MTVGYTHEAETSADLVLQMSERYMAFDPTLFQTKLADRTYTSPAVFRVNNPKRDLNFADVAWNSGRWLKFCRDYLDRGFMAWLEGLDGISPAAESGYAFPVRANHEHGNCILNVSYHKYEPAFTLHSRSTQWLPTSFLELSLMNLLSTHMQKKTGKVVPFYWLVSQVQFSTLHGFRYLLKHWYPNHFEELQIKNNATNGFNRQVRRLGEFRGGLRYAYARENRVLASVDNQYENFTPSYVVLDGELIPL